MKVKGPKHNRWNYFYEAAWEARKNMIMEIIESGETNPLRVLNIFESRVRYSEQKVSVNPNTNEVDTISYSDIPIRNEVSNISKHEGEIVVDPDCEHLPNGMQLSRVQPFLKSSYQVPVYSQTNMIQFIADYIKDKEFDAVVELGSGLSHNLIRLYNEGIKPIPLYGLEYTNSGVECGNILGALSDDIDLTSYNFDYNTPDFSMIKGPYNRVFVFSMHSIEQVEQIPEDLFEKIASIAPCVTAMHFEPFGFQYSVDGTESENDVVQRQWFTQNNWNQNFVSVIVKQFIDDKIDLTYLNKDIFGGEDVGNATSFALWHSK